MAQGQESEKNDKRKKKVTQGESSHIPS